MTFTFINCPILEGERVTVEKAGLVRSIDLVRALPCTTLTCSNASRWGQLVCVRCQALNELITLMGD